MIISSKLEDDFSHLKRSVREAGKIALGYFGQSPETMVKSDGSPVSEADLAVDNYLKVELASGRKSYGWLSEETEDNSNRLGQETIWVVDPIDGTKAFINHRPEWTISAALVSGNEPVLAVVYNPVTEEMYDAVTGQGAFLNGRRIEVSKKRDVMGCTLMAPKKILNKLEEGHGLSLTHPKYVNSIAYRLCLLSCGKTDGMMARSGSCDWDIAAADLIVREAGGNITTFQGQAVKYNKEDVRHGNLLVTNDLLHNKLLEICDNLSF